MSFKIVNMELTSDLSYIQGIIVGMEKSPGQLSKIKYKGGNEKIISDLIKQIQAFITSKKYVVDHKPNGNYQKNLREIVLFLIINTEANSPLDCTEYLHLTGIMPQLSKCLLANLIIELNLSSFYCSILEAFPLDLCEELLAEVVPCLKNCRAKSHLTTAYQFLQLIIRKIQCTKPNGKADETVEKLTDFASLMLLSLTGLYSDQSSSWNSTMIYTHMGLSILSLLDLLLMCDCTNPSLQPIIGKLLSTCCSIMNAVTLDVYCTWAEVKEDVEVLQSLISSKAFHVIEKYNKFKAASELVKMLAFIAKKPKTINEQIQLADLATIISMVNKADGNQKMWFVALMNSPVLDSDEAITCVDKWSHLCTEEDVRRLLNMRVDLKMNRANDLLIKCAAQLSVDDLILTCTRYFHRNGIGHNFNEDIQPQLVLLFNKISEMSNNQLFTIELILLLLQNPCQALSYIFAECLKNSFYTSNLHHTFNCIKHIVTAQNFGQIALQNEIMHNLPNEQNSKNYIELLTVLINSQVFTIETITIKLFQPLLEDLLNRRNYDSLKSALYVLNKIEKKLMVCEDTEVFFLFLIDTMKTIRSVFLQFDRDKTEVLKEIVDYLAYYDKLPQIPYSAQTIFVEDDNKFVQFYQKKVLKTQHHELLEHLHPNIIGGNYAENACCLVKTLPCCVTQEWFSITSSLREIVGNVKTIELLTDVVVLLCQMIKTQETVTDEVNSMLNGLKYCIQNYGIVIKDVIQPNLYDSTEEIVLIKNICRLLKYFPNEQMKDEEGLTLVQLMSDGTLKMLANDKSFACLVASIGNVNVRKILAQKVLNL